MFKIALDYVCRFKISIFVYLNMQTRHQHRKIEKLTRGDCKVMAPIEKAEQRRVYLVVIRQGQNIFEDKEHGFQGHCSRMVKTDEDYRQNKES